MTPSKSLLTRLEAKRDERAEEYGGALKHVIGADLPTADYKAGANEFIPMIVELAEALNLRKWHDDDCADATEKFKPHEMCECGASVAKQALARLDEWLGGERG